MPGDSEHAVGVRLEERPGARERGTEGLLDQEEKGQVEGGGPRDRGAEAPAKDEKGPPPWLGGHPQGWEEARLRQARSWAYVLVFVGLGLLVGVLGPSVPFLMQRVSPANPEEADLAPAFAVKFLGGLAGSFGGAMLLARIPSHMLHAIPAAGVMSGAVGILNLLQTSGVGHVAVTLCMLDCGCGLAQVCNTMMLWLGHPAETNVQWLNILNGSFGVGTLFSPAAVAMIFWLTGSHDKAVPATLVLVACLCFIVFVFVVYVPCPQEPKREGGHEEVQDEKGSIRYASGWKWGCTVFLTSIAINCAVGGENTLAAFLVAYVGGLRGDGVFDVSESEADMVTSAFWFAFTGGRFGSVFLEKAMPGKHYHVLAAQIAVLLMGWLALALFPSSRLALWTGAIMYGAGVAGLYAGFVGQLALRVQVTPFVGGCFGVACMTGIAGWQAIAAALGPSHAVSVVGFASITLLGAQCAMFALYEAKVASFFAPK